MLQMSSNKKPLSISLIFAVWWSPKISYFSTACKASCVTGGLRDARAPDTRELPLLLVLKWPCTFPSLGFNTNPQSYLSEGKLDLLQLPYPLPLTPFQWAASPQKVFQHQRDNSWYFRAAILRIAYKCSSLARHIHCSWQPADLTGGTNTLLHKPKILCGLCSLQAKDGKKNIKIPVLKGLQAHLSSNFIQQQAWKNILLDEVMISVTSCSQAQHLGLQRQRLGFPCC